MVGIAGGEVSGAPALTVLARVRLTGELAGLTGRLTDGNATPLTRIKIAARMGEIIRQLGNHVSASDAIRAEGESELSRLYSEWSTAKNRVEQKSFGERQVWLSEDKADEITALIKAYAKRAERLGIPPITAEVVDTRMVQWWVRKGAKSGMAAPVGEKPANQSYSIKGGIEKQQLVRIKGELPVLSGWRFMGRIDHEKSGNIIRQVGDNPVPARYQSSASYCEHCNKVRNRLATYIMEGPDGETKQVGSSCMNDFLGHGDAESIAAMAEHLSNFWTRLEGIANEPYDNEGGGGRVARYYGLAEYLPFVAASIRVYGWMSKTTANERMVQSTADHALSELARPADSKPVLEVTPADEELAKASIDFAKSITDDQAEAETFLSNIRVIAREGAFQPKNAGFAAAIVRAYQRVQEDAARKAMQQNAPSQWQGQVGKRQTFSGLKVERITTVEGHYGTTYIHNFRDESGNVFVWFSSGKSLENGRTYDIAATVKQHDDYKGVKQTVITRATPQNMRLDRPEDQKLFEVIKGIAASAKDEADFMAKADSELAKRTLDDANMANLVMRVGYLYWPIKNYDDFLAKLREWYAGSRK